MAVKSKSKHVVKPSPKKTVQKSKVSVKSKPEAKKKLAAASKKTVVTVQRVVEVKKESAPVSTLQPQSVTRTVTPVVKRVVTQVVERRKPVQRPSRANQFSFMKAPGHEHAYEVGGSVEVFCDHEKNRERIRGWVKGIVVQVDNKMVAVQFRSNVYLTDGWMVPDRILWFPLNSEHMRPVPGKKQPTKDFIPEY